MSVAEPYWVPVGTGGPNITYGTSPPASPNDGDIWMFPADATNGVIWQFRYRAASASAYKWEFVGGPSQSAAVALTEATSTAGGTMVNLTTIGPSITPARSGDYEVEFTATVFKGAADTDMRCGVGIGDFAAAAGLITTFTNSYGVNAISQWRGYGRITLTAAQELRVKYSQQSAGTMTVQSRLLWLKPIRVS